MSRVFIYLLMFLGFGLAIFAILYFAKSSMDKEKRIIENALNSKNKEVLTAATRELVLTPYRMPFMSQMAPDIPEDDEGFYNYFHYNFHEGYKSRVKMTKMNRWFLPLTIIPLVFVLFLHWSWFTFVLFTCAALFELLFLPRLFKGVESRAKSMEELDEKLKTFLLGKEEGEDEKIAEGDA